MSQTAGDLVVSRVRMHAVINVINANDGVVKEICIAIEEQ